MNEMKYGKLCVKINTYNTCYWHGIPVHLQNMHVSLTYNACHYYPGKMHYISGGHVQHTLVTYSMIHMHTPPTVFIQSWILFT